MARWASACYAARWLGPPLQITFLHLCLQGIHAVLLPSRTGLYNVRIFRFSPALVPCRAVGMNSMKLVIPLHLIS